MSNKKKKRHKAWLEREAKRKTKKESDARYQKSMESGNIEEMVKMLRWR